MRWSSLILLAACSTGSGLPESATLTSLNEVDRQKLCRWAEDRASCSTAGTGGCSVPAGCGITVGDFERCVSSTPCFATGAAPQSTACDRVALCSSFFIMAALAPPDVKNGMACTYAAMPFNNPFLTSGAMDIGFTDTYAPTVLVANRSKEPLELVGAGVTLTDKDGRMTLASYTTTASGHVDPGGAMPTYGTYAVPIIDRGAVDAIFRPLLQQKRSTISVRASINLHARVGGVEVTSNFFIGIAVTNGGLVTFPYESIDHTKPEPNCLAPIGSDPVTRPCIMGQDQGIDCRLCQDNPLCTPP